MQNMLQFVNEHRQRILRISYFVLILPTFLVTSMFTLLPVLVRSVDQLDQQLFRSNLQ